MKIEELMSEWAEDAKIDSSRIDSVSIKTDALKQKYLDHYLKERLILRQLKEKSKQLYKNLYEYYSGDITTDDCKNILKRELPNRVYKTKEQIVMQLEADEDYVRHNLNIGVSEEKLHYLDEVLRSLNNRGHLIRNTINFLQYKEGNVR